MANITDQIVTFSFQLDRAIKHRIYKEVVQKGHMSMLHMHVLHLVKESEGITMKELADALGITAPSATSLVNRLVQEGFLNRERDSKNRRLVHVRLSRNGKKICSAKIVRGKKIVSSILSVLSADDKKVLLRITSKLLGSLDK